MDCLANAAPIAFLLMVKSLVADMAHIVKTLREFGLCSAVHYKEMYIPEAEIQGAPAAARHAV